MKKFISLVIVAWLMLACSNAQKEFKSECANDDKDCLQRECESNNAAGCNRLGDFYWFYWGGDYIQAKIYFEKACSLGYGVGCLHVGELYDEGRGVTRDKKQAQIYYEKGCDKGSDFSCYELGNLYYEGKDVTQDFDKALSYYEKVCELSTPNCNTVGNSYLEDKKYNVAISFYEKGCDKNDSDSCKSLGNLYYEGKGVTQDFEKALSYYEKACELDASRCYWVGDSYLEDKKYNEAISFYEKGCDKNDSRSCHWLGRLYDKGEGVTQDFEKALSYYEKGCDKDWSGSCKSLGDLYYKGEGVTQDFEKAFNYYKKACELRAYECGVAGSLYLKDKKYNEAKYFMEKGCGSDCFNQGLSSDKIENYIKARLYYEIACDKGNAAGCNNLGVLYGNGRGVAKNAAKAKTLFEKSCGMNNALACQNVGYHYYDARQFAKAKAMFEKGCGANLADSCSFLGILYEFGEGVRQDLSTAKSYYGKGCDGGSQRGCDGYKKLNQRGVR